MKRILITLGVLASLATPLAEAAARACGCQDLPALTRELAEQQFLEKLFNKWAGYMPMQMRTPGDLQDRAQKEFNEAFYSNNGGDSAGTTHGGHAHMGTDLSDPNCPLVVYLYGKDGKPLRDQDGGHKTKPVSEDTYKTKQCAGMVRYTFAHERAHQQTCKKLVAANKTDLWQRADFFAKDDAQAYAAGVAVLQEEIKSLSAQCGWDSSTKNRLPNVEEAQALAKSAAKARPTRRNQ